MQNPFRRAEKVGSVPEIQMNEPVAFQRAAVRTEGVLTVPKWKELAVCTVANGTLDGIAKAQPPAFKGCFHGTQLIGSLSANQFLYCLFHTDESMKIKKQAPVVWFAWKNSVLAVRVIHGKAQYITVVRNNLSPMTANRAFFKPGFLPTRPFPAVGS